MRYVALFAAFLVLLAGFAPFAVGPALADAAQASGVPESADGPALSAASASPSLSAQPEFPETQTEIRIQLRENRSAKWTVSYYYRLETENETSAFRAEADRFEAGERGPNETVFRNFAALASEATGRDMQITNVQRSSTVRFGPSGNGTESPTPEEETEEEETEESATEESPARGELRLEFTWTEFLAEGEDDRLLLGDVFSTPNDRTWLNSLEEDQTLIIEAPSGYFVSSSPEFPIRDNAVIIEGPQQFEPDQRIPVTYAKVSDPVQPTNGPPWFLLGGALVVGALIVAGSVVLYQSRSDGDRAIGPRDGGVGATEPHNGETNAGAGADTGVTDVDTSGADPAVAGGAAVGTDEEPEPEQEEEDLSLLSDEERVERLLERNGGRMKQANIVGETGWSDAKVSQLLSAMAREGRVEKLRLGRENLISLPEDDEE